MVIEEDLLALSDVAKICDTSSSNVSNWRNRDSRFPSPYAETSAGPVWKAEDIASYLREKSNGNYDAITTGNLTSKRLAVIGRARGGKSFFISRFVQDKVGFIKLFCGNSNDKTACPIHVKIAENIDTDGFIFHTDFNSLYSEDDSKGNLKPLKEKVSQLVDSFYSQEQVEKIEEIENIIKEIREAEMQHSGRRKTNTYIETFQRPSDFLKEILRECRLGSIDFVDTPGVSGNVEATKIAKSDIYIFLIKPDNDNESQTLKKIVTEIKADIATSKVIFLYKKEGYFTTKKRYEEARLAVHNDMIPYGNLFQDFKESIISTDLDVLDPANHCILFPTMDSEEVVFSEEMFLEDIRAKFLGTFLPQNEKNKTEEFQNIIANTKNADVFVLKILNSIPLHELSKDDKKYCANQISEEKHDRVMTRDNYRLRNDLDVVYKKESSLLDKYFSSFISSQYSEMWQHIIIKYVYKKLTDAIRTDWGLGVGTHPWEEKPARTMLIEESIFADKILANILNKGKTARNEPYRKALQESNINSATWNYVGCMNNDEAIIKLEIIKDCLLNISVSSRQDIVLYRYIGGLRKHSEYKLLRDMKYDEARCMEEVKKLPF